MEENSGYVIIGILVGLTAQNFLLAVLNRGKSFSFNSMLTFIIILVVLSIIAAFMDHYIIQDESLTKKIRGIIKKCEKIVES